MKQKNVVFVCLYIISIVSTFFISQSINKIKPNTVDESCHNKYPLITPNINCDNGISQEITLLKRETNIKVREKMNNGEVSRISVFYRNLQTLQWFGINENENFAPGSLLKIPIAIAYFKQSEIEHEIFNIEYSFIGEKSIEPTVFQSILPKERLIEGKKYSVYELIKRMVRFSDNDTVPILAQNISSNFLQKTFIDLGIYVPTSGGIDQNFVSAKTTANMLRILYNSSYLDQSASNQILSFMSQSGFRNGIVAGVSDTITIANKFGEREYIDPTSGEKTIELHDCGIIYDKEKGNYILCIMTQGANLQTLQQSIADISKVIYENR